MALVLNGVIIVVLTLLIGLQAQRSLSYARGEANARASEIAQRYARDVQAQFEKTSQTLMAVAETFEGLKASWVDDRGLLNGTLSQILRSNPDLLTMWTCWEPDALDGKDKDFANKSGHDASGRFIPLWYRHGADVALDKVSGYAEPTSPYSRVKAARHEILFEPANENFGGQPYQAALIAAPIRYNGEVVGVAGAYIDFAAIAKTVTAIHPYETGYAALSAGGRVVAGNLVSLNRPLDAAVLDALRNGKSGSAVFTREQNGLFETHVPFSIGQAAESWVLSVYVPVDRVLAAAHRALYLSAGLGAAALLLLNLIVHVFARSITKPLRALADGIDVATSGVIGTAAVMTESSNTLAAGAASQASSLEQASASLEETASMAKSNAESARKMHDLSRQTREAADASMMDAQRMGSAMTAIKGSSDAVAKIIGTIDEIAFQTNILALNAAVEAARAGEAGAGFAVVAEEVRSLAQRSAAAAKQTEGQIKDAIAKTAEGVAISEKVAASLADIAGKARQVNDLAAEVAQASTEQTEGISQINSAVSDMDRITQENAAGAQQTSGAAIELQTKANVMKQSSDALIALIAGETRITQSEALQPLAPARPNVRARAHSNGYSGRNGNGPKPLVPTSRL